MFDHSLTTAPVQKLSCSPRNRDGIFNRVFGVVAF